ncbi:cupin domain-containing protein [Streptomyces sp. NPDC051920]|uniref:JmjC domain-containing protein n=1 Tax=Streptomyces sp. NPDC051920 TaxID=3155523 RepID=UPI00341AAC32
MTWDDLNNILAAHRLEPPRMRLSRDGETLLVGGYPTPVATRRHTAWHRLHPAELHSRLQEGASLSLDSVDELHPPIARLCEAIERELRTRVQANLYASWSATEGFGVHWDDHDTVVVQLDGAKRWPPSSTTTGTCAKSWPTAGCSPPPTSFHCSPNAASRCPRARSTGSSSSDRSD